MVRYGITNQNGTFSPSKMFGRVSCIKKSPTKGKYRNLSVSVPHKFVDTDYYRPLAACCVQVEPLSSLPVEYASVLTRPCSIVCEVAPIPIQDNDFQIQMNRDDLLNVECRIALPALPLSLQDYASPTPSLVRDSISMYTSMIGGRTIWWKITKVHFRRSCL